MTFDWPYYTFDTETSTLVDSAGDSFHYNGEVPTFASADAAEEFLVNHDIRGTVV